MNYHFCAPNWARRVGLVLLCAIALTTTTRAADRDWTNTAGSTWQGSSSWTPVGAPVSTDSRIVITNANTKTVTIDNTTPTSNLTISNLFIAGPVNSTNTLLISNLNNVASPFTNLNTFVVSTNGVFTVTNSTVFVGGVMTNDGTVNIQANSSFKAAGILVGTTPVTAVINMTGGVVTNNGVLTVGFSSTATGVVTITGASWVQNSGISVGRLTGNVGTLTLGGDAQMTVDAAGSGAAFIGQNGSGTVVITNTAGLSISNVGNSLFQLGRFGSGTITIAGGTFTNHATVFMGMGGAATGTVNQTAGTWFQNGDLNIGQTNVGTVALSGGSTVFQSNVVLGVASTAQGTLTVSGSAQAAVTNGAGTAQLIVGQTGRGTLALSGGNLTVNQLLVTNNTATATNSFFIFSGGTLTTSNQFLASNVKIASNSTFDIKGTWNMNGGTNLIASAVAGGGLQIIIGDGVSNAAVNIRNGAVWDLGNLNLRVGFNSSTGAVVRIDGGGVTGGAVLTNGGGLVVGSIFGFGASVIVTNGGGASVGAVTAGNVGSSNNLLAIGGGSAVSTFSFTGMNVGNGAGAANNQVIMTNAQVVSSGGQTIGRFTSANGAAQSNSVTVLANTTWNLLGGTINVGQDSTTGNVLTVNGSSAIVTNVGTVIIGNGTNAVGNSLIITNGGKFFSGDVLVGNVVGSSNNSYVIGGVGSSVLVSHGAIMVGTNAATFNTLTITNATVTASQLQVGLSLANNSANILSNARVNLLGGLLTVGRAAGSSNSLTINGGIVTNVGGMIIGGGTSLNNTLTLTNGARLFSAVTEAQIANQYGASNNSVTVAGNSLWNNSGGITIGSATSTAGGTTNNFLNITSGGTVVATSLIVSGRTNDFGNRVTLTDGTLIVTNSAGTGTLVVGKFGQGALVASGSSTAIVNQLIVTNYGAVTSTYTFNGGLLSVTGSTVVSNGQNFVVGDGVQNATLILGSGSHLFQNNLVITNAGQVLVQNASATVTTPYLINRSGGNVSVQNASLTVNSIFTNAGTYSSLNSVSTFNSAVVNQGAWITDPTTNIFNADHTITASGYISAAAGDVFIFRSNLVNQSSQSLTWDTLNVSPSTNSVGLGTKFIFEGTGLTQTQLFLHTGLLITDGFADLPVPPPTGVQTTQSLNAFVDNFAVGRLELTNTTLFLAQATPSSTTTNALFVNDLFFFGAAHLIISNNMRLYFVNSNDWTMANVTLIGNAEIHQLQLVVIPEPSVVVLVMGGLLTMYYARRRQKQRGLKK